MGLIAWYPLNGDIKDYSGNDYHMKAYNIPQTISSTKIGNKGFYFNDNTPIYTINNSIPYSENITITSWIKIDDTTTLLNENLRRGIISNYNFDSSTSTYSNISISLGCSNENVTIEIRYATIDGATNSYNSNKVLLPHQWYHIAVVYNKQSLSISIYIDGILDSTINLLKEIRLLPECITIGQAGLNNLNCDEFIGQICDVRIFNEALSPKEIYKISMAETLHFSLDNPQSEDTTNIIALNYLDCDFENPNIYISNDTYKFEIVDDFDANNGKCLEIEMLKDVTGHINLITLISDISHNPNEVYTLTIKFKIINCRNNVNDKIMILSNIKNSNENLINADFTIWQSSYNGSFSKDWLVQSQTLIMPTDIISRNIILGVNSVKAGTKFRIDWIQYEKKDHATPFIKYGKRNGSFSDMSGFNNDSNLINNSPIFSTYRLLNNGSFKFNGNNPITIPNAFITNVYDNLQEWTVSVWCNITDLTKTFQQIINFNLGLYVISATNYALLHLNKNINEYYRYSSQSIIGNTWYHIAFVFDHKNDRLDIYINGILSNGIIRKAIDDPDVPGIPSIIKIGDGFYGYMSDFRIFNKALSIDDISFLYKSRGSIDNIGNVNCKTIVEKTFSNLILNGDLSLDSNTNFSSALYNYTDGPFIDHLNCLESIIKNQEILADEFIPINPNSIYNLSGYFKGFSKPEQFQLIDGNYLKLSDGSYFYVHELGTTVQTIDGEYVTTTDGLYFAVPTQPIVKFGIACYDNNKQPIYSRNISRFVNTFTTLAAELKDGDTIVYLDTSINWYNGDDLTKKYIGIFDYPQFMSYELARLVIPYDSVIDNTILLKEPWSFGTIQIGSKIANSVDIDQKYIFCSGNEIYLTEEWNKYEGIISQWANFNDGIVNSDKFFYGTYYIKPIIIANYETDTVSRFSELYLKNMSSPQTQYNNLTSFSMNSNGEISCNEIIEIGRPIRYIRDWLGGNNIDNNNNWIEVEAFNSVNMNVALGKAITTNTSSTENINNITNGDINKGYSTFDNGWIQIDLEELIIINKIKIWHYYLDNRIYMVKTEISDDGVNWYSIFDSTINNSYQETSEGKTHYISNDKLSISDNGYLYANEFIEN